MKKITIQVVGDFYRKVESERTLYRDVSFWDVFTHKFNYLWDVIKEENGGHFDNLSPESVLQKCAQKTYKGIEEWVNEQCRLCGD